MIPIIIPCFNRPVELRQTLESLCRADLSDVMLILINDASTNEETNRMFFDFHIQGVPIMKYVNEINKGIKFNLKLGYEKAFEMGELAMNLDSDTLVKKDFVKWLLHLKKQFPDNIITGFNCVTKNKNGTERHPIIQVGNGWVKKRSVGGVNMLMDKKQYEKYMLPTLSTIGNWDANTCINSLKDGVPIIACSPSVVQHIGFQSSMGHTGIEPPDVAEDFEEKINLPDVTLISVQSNKLEELKRAAEISTRNINFGAVKLLTDRNIDSKEKYNHFIVKELYKYVDTSHLLIFQWDGYVLNYKAWEDDFLNYDYGGATWAYKDNMNVGNGGFSIRSKKFMEIVAKDDFINNTYPEDYQLCRIYRKYLEKEYGVKYMPEEIANKFSIEAYGSKVFPSGAKYSGQFGFHGYNVDFSEANIPHKPQKVIIHPKIIPPVNHAGEIKQPYSPFFRW